ncbi:MAG: hypothetical protein QXD59_06570 [Candidatus Caldarchaeum sp.]
MIFQKGKEGETMKRHSIAAVGLMAVLAIVLGGCGLFTKTDLETGNQNELLQPQSVGQMGQTIDDLFAEVARRVPAFGGMFFDRDDNSVLYVYLLNPAQKAAVEAAITAVLGPGLPDLIPPREVRVLQGQYSFWQLKEWHDKLLNLVADSRFGITKTDIDDDDNRLFIGVQDIAIQAQIERELIRLGIPLPAVRIEKAVPIEFTSSNCNSTGTLQSCIRPLVGGIQTNSFPGLCTLGLVATRNGTPGFIVNSHCTRLWGELDITGNDWHQPTTADGVTYRIGQESVDPPFFTNSQNPDCPAGWKCRKTDSAFVTRASGVTSRRGYIARPSGLTTDPRYPILTFTKLWTIVLVGAVDPPVGTVVNKVGKTTGWTQGTIRNVCARFFSADGTKRALLCSHIASYISEAGDSGAPVFYIRPNYPSTVVLWGINFAIEAGDGVFSPISLVVSELGGTINLMP